MVLKDCFPVCLDADSKKQILKRLTFHTVTSSIIKVQTLKQHLNKQTDLGQNYSQRQLPTTKSIYCSLIK